MNIFLRTRYVATDLVTSQNIQPIRRALALCHFGRTRDVYVATRIILFSSTAESSATSGYVVATERSGQSEAWASKNVERVRKKPSFVPKVDWIDAIALPNMYLWFSMFILVYFA